MRVTAWPRHERVTPERGRAALDGWPEHRAQLERARALVRLVIAQGRSR